MAAAAMDEPGQILVATNAHAPGAADAIVVANGDVDAISLRALTSARPGALLIAADGGALAVEAAGARPDLVIGDGDSLSAADRERLTGAGVELRLAPPDKDESDTELCVLAAVAAGATRISICGALGGERLEHALANILLLADPRLDGCEIVLHAGASRLVRIGSERGPGSLEIVGSPGDFVSLLAVGGPVRGVRTSGLRYPLDGETLMVGPARGLSNELTGVRARVTTADGRLIVVTTPRAAIDEPAAKEGTETP